MGWLLPERKVKTIHKSFFHLKDSYGSTQLLVDHLRGSSWAELSQIPVESTVLIEGNVVLRPVHARKPGPTGSIDVDVDKVVLLNPANEQCMPFLPSNIHNLPNEELRARYRYLDLRRTVLSDNLKKRSQVTHIIRNVLHGFTEVETPVLLRSSPEGAREFLVPARSAVAAPDVGNADPVFYALSQSPQQPKQLLICSGGVDKYFQIAKCFRDEDGRKDRQPEFTQVDLEMAFVSWGENQVSDLVEKSSNVWRIGGLEVRQIAEDLFGSDKPDTRFGLEIINISDVLHANQTSPLTDSILECIVVRKSTDSDFIKASRALAPEADTNIEHITLTEANRETWLSNSKAISHVYSNIAPTDLVTVNKALNLKPGDDIWLSYRPRRPTGGSTSLGRVRLQICEQAQVRGEFVITKDPHFLWITEFPLFTRDDADKDHLAHGRWSSSHHPFTAPMWEDIGALYRGEAENVRGQHYDLVLNGVEIGGGSVRVHDAKMQDYIFTTILGLTDEEKHPFQQLLHALQCGAPPHGGIALGLDRIMAILCKTQSIRDVIAFPKSASGTDLLFKSPAAVSREALEEYGIMPRQTSA
ncbi:Aspartate--tRNA ligase, mitochondrial [Psilocybe cubensis]|uniref:Aspartate--tRNA ligase, mitochondrial n=1 Tax=Psilocybe cubensis TaxID=181762 RepID=A0ACB8H417_PSICU|nr:Aspartate--tRNA ligase, mitochondrial [Psilocybe cubensis]KAH9482616.1 Aspartate--tRNA ligase, mitochondrial [Psilocybe cubensis]